MTIPSSTSDSAFRRAERDFQGRPDEFWEFLEEHKYDDPTLAIGWAIERAKRFYNRDQASIAARTAVYDEQGRILEEPITRSFVSAMLSARSKVSPPVYKRLARATDTNPIDFYIAEGWVDLSDVAAYDLPDSALALPIIQKVMALPQERRPRARAVVLAMLDSITDIYEHANDPVTANDGTTKST